MSTLKGLLGAGGGSSVPITGTLIEGSSLALTIPDYLPCNGGIYLESTYPDLHPLIPPAFPDVKLTDPSTLPTGTGYGTAFSPDGVYLSVVHATAPFITIYKRSGDVFTKLTNPSTLPTGQGNGTAFSPDGVYLSVVHSASPFITIYKRSGDVFTKLTDPSTLPTGQGNGTAFSPDGVYLSVANAISPFITIYYPGYDIITQFKLKEIPFTDGYKKFIKT